ncbi:hypothetical protein GCM10007049_11210 [Echinicola pacifica]|uniref:Histone deacetylase n=1 Tax=Echinicola pacifica TaxID=346377 RepID=A0A918PT63_9BACT|nr:hypothetical protein [Echinicola pacifica]GGZ20390.1 hypothetical protein GCM10007049_11210 [Echinicola pacifica]
MTDYVWYASYGSNLLESRFLCYIQGGKPAGSSRTYSGCKDVTLPTGNRPHELPYELYFAKKASVWNDGGVAFIDVATETEDKTLARKYRITRSQFMELVQQENNIPDTIILDLDQVKADKYLCFIDRGWYNTIVYLGDYEGEPIFTFTSSTLYEPNIKPDIAYLMTIIGGLKECHNLSDESIMDYLYSKRGIRDMFDEEELANCIRKSIR